MPIVVPNTVPIQRGSLGPLADARDAASPRRRDSDAVPRVQALLV